MNEYLFSQLDQSPAVTLLRSENAGFILSFFQTVFSGAQKFQIGCHAFISSLTQYNQLQANPLTRRASDYLEIWADDKHRFLRKYYVDGHDEPQVELAYEISSLMSWLQSRSEQEFVGAQSRISALFQMLDKLASYSDTDPKARISKLQQERALIDDEITQIKKTGTVLGWDDLRKREYLSHIMEDARRLFADFALIEDIFKENARHLKEKMVAEQLSKGEILAQVLDMHDALEESDQGKSFRAFWDFLISSTQQEQLGSCLDKILQDLSQKPYLKGTQMREYTTRLKGFKADLLQRGRKVLASQNRLTREIRKLLVQNARQDMRAVQGNIAQIKSMCLSMRDVFSQIATDTLVEIEHKPHVHLPMERPLWSAPAATKLEFGAPEVGTMDDADATICNGPSALACWQLEERIDQVLQQKGTITLTELLSLYPPEFTLEELVGYIAVGMKSQQHQVDTQCMLPIDDYWAPHTVFHRPPES